MKLKRKEYQKRVQEVTVVKGCLTEKNQQSIFGFALYFILKRQVLLL